MSQNTEYDKNQNTKKRGDRLLIIGIFLVAVLLFLGRHFFLPKQAVEISVWADGEEIMTLDLNKDEDLIIQGNRGGTNHLIIKDGKAWMEDASCPDKLCVKQGVISQTGQTLICAPNRVSVTITGQK